MKTKLTVALLLVFVLTTWAGAWESHYDTPKFDDNGDMRFNSEHVKLTKQSIKDIEWMNSMFSGLPECSEVRDFNSDLPLLKWNTLRTRTFCPAIFSELPDYFYSIEDYINQGKECPPFDEWIVGDCHNFSHFMGGLNSTHFPPQTRTNYEKYHSIAVALRDKALDLTKRLDNKSALQDYSDYPQECAMEALSYESIAQHFLQDQWAMGHMWYRWGSPDIHDFPIYTTNDNSAAGLKRVNAAFGQFIGGISGMIHGWKSTVDPLWEGWDFFKNDAMSYHIDGVEWTRILGLYKYPGTGDLFLAEQLDHDKELPFGQDRFYTQRDTLSSCSRSSLKQIYDQQYNWNNNDYEDCWNNFATNKAMYIGLGYSPSYIAHVAIKVASKVTDILDDTFLEVLNDKLDGADRELTQLVATFYSAAVNDPYDTYIAEGYMTEDRDPLKRLKLFSIMPNDVYNKYPNYYDPARNAPGDPADTTFVSKLDNKLFGVRQVKYFNKCHAEIYCDDPSIIKDYRQKCESGSDLDCQICEELAARFFLGDPPLCEILADGVNPDPGNQNPPKSASEIKIWCGSDECPTSIAGSNLTVDGCPEPPSQTCMNVSYIENDGEDIIWDPTAAQIASADVNVSGCMDGVTISWTLPDVYYVRVTGGTTDSTLRYSYNIMGNMDGLGSRYTIQPPIQYGNYDYENTNIFQDGWTEFPSPALTDEFPKYYQVGISTLYTSGAKSASIGFNFWGPEYY